MSVKIKTKVSINYEGFRKLKKDIEKYKAQVGYINSPTHWGGSLTVGELAQILHYDSPWGRFGPDGGFMLDTTNQEQTQKIVNYGLSYLGKMDFKSVVKMIAEEGREVIVYNISQTSNPPNSASWAEAKGFNDPLRFGSAYGQEPNLISEVKAKVVIGDKE